MQTITPQQQLDELKAQAHKLRLEQVAIVRGEQSGNMLVVQRSINALDGDIARIEIAQELAKRTK